VPLEALADRALRALGHEKTIATGWAGAGSFRELLRRNLPDEIRLTGEPPYLAYDAKRHIEEPAPRPAIQQREAYTEIAPLAAATPSHRAAPERDPLSLRADEPMALDYGHRTAPSRPVREAPQAPLRRASAAQQETLIAPPRNELRTTATAQPIPTPAPREDAPSAIQQSIARIQEACQAPPLAPPEYRMLFEIMAKEINDNDLIGAQTLTNITQRAQERGLDVRRDDVRFVLEVVSEADPWFEHGASANLFAGRFRNFVVARCRGQGLNLSADELDLVDAWFAGGTMPQNMSTPRPAATQQASATPSQDTRGSGRWWSLDDGQAQTGAQRVLPTSSLDQGHPESEEFPRIVRTRLRG
jgi:hypothetical protein